MGTSSSRRAPSTRLWRLAKAAATRYLSPESPGALEAREVVARYLAAVKETGGQGDQSGLAAFRLTRKVAQKLGDFGDRAVSQGWEAALEAWGLTGMAGQPPEIWAQALSASLIGPGGGLEEAVARVSLATILRQHLRREGWSSSIPSPTLLPEPGRLVREFLGRALYSRLVLDLGESLEAASPGYSRLKLGLEGIKEWIGKAGDLALDESPGTGQWPGLAGWVWVSKVLETLIKRLSLGQIESL
jgi:hypothetical protein